MSNDDPDQLDADQLLAERKRLEQLYQDKFVRTVTLMFTDLKGSTSITETEGDFATRELLKTHNDILFPIIEDRSGTLVKTMGDGTMSFFEEAQHAVEAAMDFQKAIFEHNRIKKPKVPIQVRIGINTGEGIVEEDDVYGDVVNVASRFESIADAGEVYFSSTTYERLSDPHAFYNRVIKTASLKGKKEQVQVYKAFWSEHEIKLDMENQQVQPAAKTSHSKKAISRVIFWLGALMLFVFTTMQAAKFLDKDPQVVETRSTTHQLDKDADSIQGADAK